MGGIHTARVTAGEGLEAIHELATAAAVRVGADARGNHDPVRVHDPFDDRIDEEI